MATLAEKSLKERETGVLRVRVPARFRRRAEMAARERGSSLRSLLAVFVRDLAAEAGAKPRSTKAREKLRLVSHEEVLRRLHISRKDIESAALLD